MSPEQIELVRKAMALPGWGWRRGMFTQKGTWVAHVFKGGATMLLSNERAQWEERCHGPCVPDLADPTGATDGALLRLLGPGWTAASTPSEWDAFRVYPTPGHHPDRVPGYGATLAEACCHAAVALGRWPGGLP
jgi:hypothetical protein